MGWPTTAALGELKTMDSGVRRSKQATFSAMALVPAIWPSSTASCNKGRSPLASPARNSGSSPTCSVSRLTGGWPCSSSSSPSVSSPRPSSCGRRPMAATTWSTTMRVSPARTTMLLSGPLLNCTSWSVITTISFSSRCRNASVTFGSDRPASFGPRPSAVTSSPSRASACAISTPSGPRPTTATRGPSVLRSNKVSVVRMRLPKRFHSSGTTGLEPGARMSLRAASTLPLTSIRLAASSLARPSMARQPRPSVALIVLATNSSRSLRTRRKTAGRSSCSPLAPRMPKASK